VLHEVEFRILEINGAPPPGYQRGSKHTVFVAQDVTARLAVSFGSYVDPLSPYLYHCHILRHETRA